jgi:hypothetical protein
LRELGNFAYCVMESELSRYSYGLGAGRPGFDSQQVQTGSGAHPNSYPVCTRALSPSSVGTAMDYEMEGRV